MPTQDFKGTASTNVKLGTFSYDLSTESGTLAVTGVGFTPRIVEFMGDVNATGVPLSIGWDDGTTHYCISNETSSTPAFANATTDSIRIYTTASAGQKGRISSLDADGFTLSFTKVNSPTGTAVIFYKATR